ncbi:MAG: acylphosphatase [Deltaproteobacteria bacterium]|nr:acylphosphatase [Deltaproteobacteria bacterium]
MVEIDFARVNIIVTGRVQGVFFRASALEQAQSYGIKGWVQNLPDSSLEIEAEGPRYALEEFIKWCKHGPPDAFIKEVFIRWGKYQNEFTTFRICG